MDGDAQGRYVLSYDGTDATRQAIATTAVAEATSGNSDAASRDEHWVSANPAGIGRCRATFSDIQTSGSQDLARVSVALRELRELTPSR